MTLGSPATWFIFLAFGIKCAFPLLHNWLGDAYPAATVTGHGHSFGIHDEAGGFMHWRAVSPGTEILVYIGATMTLFPIFYAVIENDLRRVLAYSLNIQLGFYGGRCRCRDGTGAQWHGSPCRGAYSLQSIAVYERWRHPLPNGHGQSVRVGRTL